MFAFKSKLPYFLNKIKFLPYSCERICTKCNIKVLTSCLEQNESRAWTRGDGIASANAGSCLTTDYFNRNTQAICLFVLESQSNSNAFPHEKFIKGVKLNNPILTKQ